MVLLTNADEPTKNAKHHQFSMFIFRENKKEQEEYDIFCFFLGRTRQTNDEYRSILQYVRI